MIQTTRPILRILFKEALPRLAVRLSQIETRVSGEEDKDDEDDRDDDVGAARRERGACLSADAELVVIHVFQRERAAAHKETDDEEDDDEKRPGQESSGVLLTRVERGELIRGFDGGAFHGLHL